MSDDLTFDRSFDLAPGRAEEVVPGVRRVVADNPGPFTFKGTLTYILGRGKVAIIDPGPDAYKLLMACTPTAEMEPFVEELILASSNRLAPRRVDVDRVLVEQLSAREVTVLRYLCSRLTNDEIASALFVSSNTMKTHVKAVYRKLGVASRADAVSVGRSLRLI